MPENKIKTIDSFLKKPEETEAVQAPDFDKGTVEALKKLRCRMVYARDERDKTHEEFDGMTYPQYWVANEDGANTSIKPKKNKSDITFQSGTLRTKLMGLQASLTSLNLKPDIMAYDQNDVQINSLGQGMEDIADKTKEMENDEEKQALRQYELLKQGDVFIEEIWDEPYVIDKQIITPFNGKFSKKFWKTTESIGTGKPETRIIPGINVYLGDLTQYDSAKQPYIFTVTKISYTETESIYGEWENFKYVSKTHSKFIPTEDDTVKWNEWTLTDTPDGMVEIIKYQDVPNYEYQIILNGVPMLPFGSPMPWGCYYNIIQQHLEPIRSNFAYGKSFIFKNKNLVYLFDEMIRMALLKTWKSFMPPLLNNSGRVLNQTAMMPGKIIMGVQPGALAPLMDRDTQGVTSSEYSMMSEVSRIIDQNTVSQTFTGMKERGEQTATQVVELQRQARIMLGNLILAASLLEKKLTDLRVKNLLNNWFEPIDTTLDKVRGFLKNRYRVVSRKRSIGGEGLGIRYVVTTEDSYTPEQIMKEEDLMERNLGMPVRMTIINPRELKQAELVWGISVVPKEKKSSEMSKMMFQEMINQAIALGLQLNPQYIEEQFAEVWDKDPTKLFVKGQQVPQVQNEGTLENMPNPQNMPARATQTRKPTINEMMKSIGNKQLTS